MTDSKIVTIARPANPGEQMLIEALLDGEGIPYFAKNTEVQNLFGAGQIGGFNLATGGVQVQVSSEDEERALALLEQRMGEGLPADTEAGGVGEDGLFLEDGALEDGALEDGTLQDVAALESQGGTRSEAGPGSGLERLEDSDDLNAFRRYSLYSLVWSAMSPLGSLLSIGGFAAGLGIAFGVRALLVRSRLPQGSVRLLKPVLGIAVGAVYFAVWLFFWQQVSRGG